MHPETTLCTALAHFGPSGHAQDRVHSRLPVGRKATLMGHFAVVLLARDAPNRKIIWLLSVNNGNTATCAVQRGETSNQVQLHTQFLAFWRIVSARRARWTCSSCIQTLSFETHRHALLVVVRTKIRSPEYDYHSICGLHAHLSKFQELAGDPAPAPLKFPQQHHSAK